MTSSPFSNLYFSNFSCGTSSGAGLAAASLAEADFAGVCAGVFAVDWGLAFAGVFDGACACASAHLAKHKIISPSVKTLRKKCFITASFQMETIWRSANGQHSQMSSETHC